MTSTRPAGGVGKHAVASALLNVLIDSGRDAYALALELGIESDSLGLWLVGSGPKIPLGVIQYLNDHGELEAERERVRETGREAGAIRQAQMREARALGRHTDQQWEDMRFRYDNACLACKDAKGFVTRDHIIPISEGGTDAIENIQPLCLSCNVGNKSFTDYRIGDPRTDDQWLPEPSREDHFAILSLLKKRAQKPT